ncbi:E3 ubiquitin-protein ligase RZF1-like [Amaranthus tricolor]|uniref:E3 ubiquitin-protein ligase RZF1-like n=1 Tax=Amaranthus tricolor TaxID=29722 RepID=UPI0025894F4F|nr:E3 ubiquitin-protein ligase RZF1-like [Amaranthus tricolor]
MSSLGMSYTTVADCFDQYVRIIETFDPLMFRNNHDYRFQVYEGLTPFLEHRRRYGLHDDSILWLIYRAQLPDSGSRLDEMTERLLIESETPSPDSQSAIDALETIKITPNHIESDNSHSNCPICLDRFEIGTKARKTPCNHIYHSECIVPWLVLRNTCPVCRHQLESGPVNCRQNSRNTSSDDSNTSRRNTFSFILPVRSQNNGRNCGNPPFVVGEIHEN